MKTLKEKQLAFLLDELEYRKKYGRAMNSKGRCSYVQGCAIGRLLDPDLAAKLDDRNENYLDASVSCEDVFVQLPDSLKELGMEFLLDIQKLHDDEFNWGQDKGSYPAYYLTVRGLKEVAEIKSYHSLDN